MRPWARCGTVELSVMVTMHERDSVSSVGLGEREYGCMFNVYWNQS